MSEATLHHLQVPVTGRYLVRPAFGGAAGPLLVGFHGYAERADQHLAMLEAVPGIGAWHLVAIQALHPFYRGRTGDVVASWMTTLDREQAIADNIRYVSAVLGRVREDLVVSGPTAAIGFSQGTAMAYRALARSGHSFDGIIALAGDLPPDATPAATGFPRVLIGRGTGDTWYTEQKLEADLARLAEFGVTPTLCVFAGGHEWTTEFRGACGQFLEALVRAPRGDGVTLS
jgi:predicted esterase